LSKNFQEEQRIKYTHKKQEQKFKLNIVSNSHALLLSGYPFKRPIPDISN